jgi:DNA-binding SARP family transcriptional activator
LGGIRQAKTGARQTEALRISADAANFIAGNRAIASMRITWIESLRKVLSEYHSILMTDYSASAADQRRLSYLGAQLDLMLNLNEENQKKLA